MNRKLFITGLLMGMLAIILGAFAAHGLESLISADAIDTFETGVKYQMYNALFLLIVGSLGSRSIPQKTLNLCFYLTVFGVLFFSGSIYLLATNSLTAFDFVSIGFITPLGGILMIISWLVLLVQVLKLKNQ